MIRECRVNIKEDGEGWKNEISNDGWFRKMMNVDSGKKLNKEEAKYIKIKLQDNQKTGKCSLRYFSRCWELTDDKGELFDDDEILKGEQK